LGLVKTSTRPICLWLIDGTLLLANVQQLKGDKMKSLLSIVLCLALLLGGCSASQYLGNTVASYNPATGFYYQSNKNQEGLDASGTVNTDGSATFAVKTNATTPEAAINAALQGNLATIQLITKLIDAAVAAGQLAATKGVPIPKLPVPAPVVTPTP
jgi:PBP1b-binding outer membrane lipoprotein LpoB